MERGRRGPGATILGDGGGKVTTIENAPQSAMAPRTRAQFARGHTSIYRDEIAIHNEGALEGVCLVIDELSSAGFYEAAEVMAGRLFRPRQAVGR